MPAVGLSTKHGVGRHLAEILLAEVDCWTCRHCCAIVVAVVGREVIDTRAEAATQAVGATG